MMSKNNEYCDRKNDMKYFHLQLKQLQAQLQLQAQVQIQQQEQIQSQIQIQQQAQVQAQAQAQNDTDTSSFNNIGNPVIHVNVNTSSGEDEQEKSAFRAIKDTPTKILVVNTTVKVSFTDEQFDLNNEYDSNTSTFVAKTAGVYLFTATLAFDPTRTNVDYEFGVGLSVNNALLDADVDYTGFNARFVNYVDISEIIMLNEGDKVDIVALSTTKGTIIANPSLGFAGAKLL